MRMTYDPAQEQPFSPGVCWRAPPLPAPGPVSAPGVGQDFETREIRSMISDQVKEPSTSISQVCSFENHRRASEMQTLMSSLR